MELLCFFYMKFILLVAKWVVENNKDIYMSSCFLINVPMDQNA